MYANYDTITTTRTIPDHVPPLLFRTQPRLARGGRADFLPWIERITHSVCQELSGDIPYPAVFNSCKMGYR